MAFSRAAVAEWAGLTAAQLDYLLRLEVVAPDVGGERKKFSHDEARMVVIAGSMIRAGLTPQVLKGPIGWLREFAAKEKGGISDFDYFESGAKPLYVAVLAGDDSWAVATDGGGPPEVGDTGFWFSFELSRLFAARREALD